MVDAESLHDSNMGVPLETFTRRACQGGVAGMIKDYTDLVSRDVPWPSTICDMHPQLNRFTDIKCFDSTRVKLLGPPHDYINANYVDSFRDRHKFICTQGPMEHTIMDFWRMVWQENTVVVVALTKFGGNKCCLYLPVEKDQRRSYADITVVNKGTRVVRNAFDATVLLLLKGTVQRHALHICYYAWPDKGVPSEPTEMMRLVDDLKFNQHRLVNKGRLEKWLPPTGLNPIVVHCSAGVGRTGTLVALDICMRRLDATADRRGGPLVDLFNTVVKMRTQRAKAVQRPEQFVYLNLALIDYALHRRLYHNVSAINMSLFIRPDDRPPTPAPPATPSPRP